MWELQATRGALCSIDFDCRDVERKRGKTESRFADLKPSNLFVENALYRLDVRSNIVFLPVFLDQTPKREDEENASAAGRIEYNGFCGVFDT